MTIQQSRQRLKEAEEAYKSAHPGRDLTEAREELTHARGEYQLDCVAMVERLPAILDRFSGEAIKWHSACRDEWHPNIGTKPGDDSDAIFTVGDLRALAKLYEEVR